MKKELMYIVTTIQLAINNFSPFFTENSKALLSGQLGNYFTDPSGH